MKGVGLQWASEPSQGRLLFLHLGEFVFLADNDDPVERVWADEKSALAERGARVGSHIGPGTGTCKKWQGGTWWATVWNAAVNDLVYPADFPNAVLRPVSA